MKFTEIFFLNEYFSNFSSKAFETSIPKRTPRVIEKQTEKLPRKELIQQSLDNNGAMVLVDSIDEAVELANKIAPEHLELCVRNPFLLVGDIKNAGAIFLGEYSPEPLGDYMAGPNHVLPTNGTARFYSPLSVDDFVKKPSIISYSKEALENVWQVFVKSVCPHKSPNTANMKMSSSLCRFPRLSRGSSMLPNIAANVLSDSNLYCMDLNPQSC